MYHIYSDLFLNFFSRYGTKHGVPGKNPKAKDKNMKVTLRLPASHTFTSVYKEYKETCEHSGKRGIAPSTFRKVWSSHAPHVKVVQPNTNKESPPKPKSSRLGYAKANSVQVSTSSSMNVNTLPVNLNSALPSNSSLFTRTTVVSNSPVFSGTTVVSYNSPVFTGTTTVVSNNPVFTGTGTTVVSSSPTFTGSTVVSNSNSPVFSGTSVLSHSPVFTVPTDVSKQKSSLFVTCSSEMNVVHHCQKQNKHCPNLLSSLQSKEKSSYIPASASFNLKGMEMSQSPQIPFNSAVSMYLNENPTNIDSWQQSILRPRAPSSRHIPITSDSQQAQVQDNNIINALENDSVSSHLSLGPIFPLSHTELHNVVDGISVDSFQQNQPW